MSRVMTRDWFRPYGTNSEQLKSAGEVLPAPTTPRLSLTGRFSGLVVVMLIAFVVLGPLLWRQDPNTQWLSQISAGPSLGSKALLVEDQDVWQPDPGVTEAAVVSAHTEFVRLQWPRTQGRAYQVFRNLAEQAGLGVPLATIEHGYYQDSLQLRPRAYRYSIVDSASGELRFQLEARPVPAISRFETELQGLPTLDNKVEPQWLKLPAHPLGTDALGRDMLARLMAGGQTSLLVGIVAPLLFISLGCAYGAVAASLGGWVDNLAMRLVDFVIALPFLLFMILLRVAFGIGPGEDGVLPLIVAMVVMSWTGSARLIRGQVLSLRQQPYVEAARLAGMGQLQIIVRHMLPNLWPLILVSFSFAVPSAIFTEAFLSFIGLGVAPPSTSWGAQCNDGMKTLLSQPLQLLLPAAMISTSVLAFNLLGDALRDAGDRRKQEA